MSGTDLMGIESSGTDDSSEDLKGVESSGQDKPVEQVNPNNLINDELDELLDIELQATQRLREKYPIVGDQK